MMSRAKKLPSRISRRGYRPRLKQHIAMMLSQGRNAEDEAPKLPLPEEQSADENVILFPLGRIFGRPAAALLLGFCLEVARGLDGGLGSAIVRITGAA